MSGITAPLASATSGPVGLREVVAAESPLASNSAVSWAAIFAGAVGAAALALILLLLGTGLGLSSVSPWAEQGASATAIGVSAIVWLSFTQFAASAMGGYLAGRLRTKWILVHSDEIYFRDTAHGFLAWALATLVTAAFLTSAIGTIVGQGAEAGAKVVGATAAGVGAAGVAATSAGAEGGQASMGLGYFVDTLFRTDVAATPSAGAGGATMNTAAVAPAGGAAPSPARSNAEVLRIFANDLASGLTPQDTRYVGQLVAQRTGLSQADAEKRVSETFAALQTKLTEAKTAAREAADKARKASAITSLWLFVALLIGAFVASLAATFGGRRRDL